MMTQRRLLVVDDERIVAEDIRECLLQMGCEVCATAQSGPEAVEKARHFRPDLVLMDIVLQGEMDGVEAAGQIRDDLGIPSVFLSAYSDHGVLARAKDCAPLGYIVKPFDEAGLRSAVEVALHRISVEAALKESHDWFATTLRSIGDGVVATGPDGVVNFLNESAEVLTGHRTAWAVGRPIDEVVPLIDDAARARIEGPVAAALRGQDLARPHCETSVVKADGNLLAVECSAAPIRNARGEPVGAVLVVRDATERRMTARRVAEEQMELERLVNHRTSEILDANRRLVAEIEERKRVEEALQHRVGMQKLLSSVTSQFLHLRRDEMAANLASVLRELGGFLDADATYLIGDAPGGRPGEIDVLSEWRAAAVPITVPTASPDDGICTGPSGKLLAAWRSRFESVESVLVSRRDLKEAAGHEGPAPPPAFDVVAKARGAEATMLVPLIDEEEITGFLGADTQRAGMHWTREDALMLRMVADVIQTALHTRKAAEENENLQQQLIHSQKMEAIGKLSGGIAHDFNNMLLPIIGYSDLLLEGREEGEPMVEELREIRRSAQRAAALTRQMLAFSRKQVIKTSRVDLHELLHEIRRMLGRIIGEDIALETELDPDLPPVVADPGQIEQVLMNLVVNARDAMPSGGTIRIATSVVDPDLTRVPLIGARSPASRFVRIAVSDDGHGIDPQVQSKVFEPFFTTKGSEGTGLGLSVVYGIVEQHQGGVGLKSKPGVGTEISIYLPAVAPVPPKSPRRNRGTSPAQATPRETAGRGERILLVEDEPAVIQLVSQALCRHGYTVFEATTHAGALATFEREGGRFDLIFSDAVLPDGNGVDLLDRFLTAQPDLRVLLSSGYTDKDSLIELAAGRDISFLQKPYPLPHLFRTVRDVIDGCAVPAVLH